MASQIGRYSTVGRYSRTGDITVDPPPAVDVEITITPTQAALSQLQLGVTWVTSSPVTFDRQNWPNVKINGPSMFGHQSIHIFPFGLSEPWSGLNEEPTNPAPTSSLNFGTTSQSHLLNGALTDMRSFSASEPIHMKLYGACWWMKHRVAADGSITNCTVADKYSSEGRVKNSRLPDFLYMIKEVAKLGMSYGVRWFSFWNELKGYVATSVSDVSMNSGAGDTAMGYGYLYQQACEAVLQAADDMGIARTQIKMGAPYNTLRGRSSTAAAVGSGNPYAQYLYARPWGWMDNTGYNAIETFLNNVVAHNLRFDFLSVDGADFNKGLATDGSTVPGDWYAANDWDNGLHYHDWHLWLKATMAARGLVNKPIVWDEFYRYAVKTVYPNGETRDAYDAALCADFLRWCVLDEVKWPQAWGPFAIQFNNGRCPGLLTGENTSAGGKPTPYGRVAELFKLHFPPGTSVKTSTTSDNTLLTVPNATHCIVINKLNSVQTTRINGGVVHTLTPHQTVALPY